MWRRELTDASNGESPDFSQLSSTRCDLATVLMYPGAQFFYVVARNEQPVDEGHWRDTVLVHARETIDVALIPRDAGLWMLHCHILEHAESGMISPGSLYRWMGKPLASAAPRFARLVAEPRAGPTTAVTTGRIAVQVGDARVQVEAGFDAVLLRAVVAALSGKAES